MISYLEWAANAFFVISVFLAARNHIYTWWTGIIGCILFAVLFYQVRTLWEEKNGILSQEDLINIAQTQTEIEGALQQQAKQYLFCDTSPLTTLCYSQAIFNTRPEVLEAYSERNYHHTFLCEPDFPFVQDGTRKNDQFRQWQHQWYLQELKQREIPYSVLTGPPPNRLNQVCEELGFNFC